MVMRKEQKVRSGWVNLRRNGASVWHMGCVNAYGKCVWQMCMCISANHPVARFPDTTEHRTRNASYKSTPECELVGVRACVRVCMWWSLVISLNTMRRKFPDGGATTATPRHAATQQPTIAPLLCPVHSDECPVLRPRPITASSIQAAAAVFSLSFHLAYT